MYWLILFTIITKALLLKYGVPYLFLYPEYLGKVNFVSHFIVGLCLGAFIMAFNLSSYVVNGFRFPFLATLNRPFIKYCQNNIVLPASFSIAYILAIIRFQAEFERLTAADISMNVVGFLLGNLVFILFTSAYFIATNKNSSYYQRKQVAKLLVNPVKDLFSSGSKWNKLNQRSSKEWKVATYISKWGQIAIARDSSHYKKETLEQVFAQNRINASFFQVGVIALLFLLGWFSDTGWLMIPAAASILLFFTILIMLTSAFYSWFKGWTPLALFGALLLLNLVSTTKTLQYKNQAYGVSYDSTHPAYAQEAIRLHQLDDDAYKQDILDGLKYLEHWKENQQSKKPVAVFINVPGGGLRSAMWVIHSLHQAQVASRDKLWSNTVLISGSSGGMIGASYLRAYYQRLALKSTDLTIDSIINDIAKDKLNTVAASAVMNDIFFRFKKFERYKQTYTIDRAWAFENKLNQDTRGWLSLQLADLKAPEFEADIPMLVLAPTISNDGRKLVISSQGVSYLAHNTAFQQINENIEFRRFFSAQNADSLSFISALRMSATFPYVFPAANLPSEPPIEILDAGIRDNYGISNTLKFMYSFRHWLYENTSKVVILQIRDQQKFIDKKSTSGRSLFESISQPAGTFYNTVLDIQDYQMEDQLRLAYEWYDGEIEVVELILERSETNPISLSWHLTEKEKQRILRSIRSEYNKKALKRIRSYLE
ncbi:MAG: patatin-like phospholipase family protein [Cryomorphaceae bacterium]